MIKDDMTNTVIMKEMYVNTREDENKIFHKII